MKRLSWQARAIQASLMASALSALMMTGCASLNMTESGFQPGAVVQGGAISGVVHGGQFPITGSLIGLYQVGSAGYGKGATQLLSSAVTTGSGGSFSLTKGGTGAGGWTCNSGSYVYITASGGNPGNADSSNQGYAGLVALLGKCDDITSSTSLIINEVTTVAAVWALQNFITISPGTSLNSNPGSYYGASTYVAPSFQIGAPSTNMQGLYNAFEVANVLVNIKTGTAYGTSSSTIASGLPAMANAPGTSSPLISQSQQTVTVESHQINLIASILAACVNTESSSTTCSTMASGVIPSGTAPSDTLQIAYEMAKNPMYNVQTTFGYATPSSPFQTVASAVADWTIGYNVLYNVNPSAVNGEEEILNTVQDIKFDGFGNAYFANTGHGTEGTNSSDTPELTEFDPAGNFVATINSYNLGSDTAKNMVTMPNVGANYNVPIKVAIDPSNNVYMPDPVSGAIMYVPAASGAGTTGAVVYPAGTVAVESSTAIGTVENYYGYGLSTAASSTPTAVASDGAGNIFISLTGTTTGTTFGTATLGIATLVPSFTSGGPLTAASGSMVSGSPGGVKAGLFVVPTPASDGGTNTWTNGGFVYVPSQSDSCSGGKGELEVYYDKTGTSTGSSSSTSTTLGQALPSVFTNGTCTSATFKNAGTWTSPSGSTYSGIYEIDTLNAMGVDSNDNLWFWSNPNAAAVTGFNTQYLTQVTPTYTTNPTTGALVTSFTSTIYSSTLQMGGNTFTGGAGMVIDGANTAWVMSSNANGTVLGFNPNATFTTTGATAQNTPLYGAFASTFPSTKYCTGLCGGYLATASNPYRSNKWGTGSALAVDLSGNLWAGQSGTNGESFTIIVGAATPTVAPLSVAAKNHTYGVEP